MQIIGDEGLEKAKLVIAQSASRVFDVEHKGPDGEVVDHSQSTAYMAFENKKGRWQVDGCCTCAEDRIRVAIPGSVTKSLPVGQLDWDLFVVTAQGDQIRVLYGEAKVVDTYAMDEV